LASNIKGEQYNALMLIDHTDYIRAVRVTEYYLFDQMCYN